jgi:hypothetical protein
MQVHGRKALSRIRMGPDLSCTSCIVPHESNKKKTKVHMYRVDSLNCGWHTNPLDWCPVESFRAMPLETNPVKIKSVRRRNSTVRSNTRRKESQHTTAVLVLKKHCIVVAC